ncbi:MAG: hypothetical protein RI973_1908 [Bacteroidota bacterium]|jgi:hypothetical protein
MKAQSRKTCNYDIFLEWVSIARYKIHDNQ